MTASIKVPASNMFKTEHVPPRHDAVEKRALEILKVVNRAVIEGRGTRSITIAFDAIAETVVVRDSRLDGNAAIQHRGVSALDALGQVV